MFDWTVKQVLKDYQCRCAAALHHHSTQVCVYTHIPYTSDDNKYEEPNTKNLKVVTTSDEDCMKTSTWHGGKQQHYRISSVMFSCDDRSYRRYKLTVNRILMVIHTHLVLRITARIRYVADPVAAFLIKWLFIFEEVKNWWAELQTLWQ